ncbi:MAG: glycosyl hydrolase-related protein [Bacilli bacterium]|nr:glycosyl hydrolase-related protein [Bacilli bacterium]
MNLRLEEKLDTLVKLLNDWRLTKQIPVKVSYLELHNSHLSAAQKAKGFKPFKEPFMIYKPDTYIWFKGEFTINRNNDKNLNAYFLVNPFFGRDEWDATRPQGTLYLNNRLVQGIDINHREVLLEDGHYTFYLYMYTHEFAHSFPLHFSLVYKDKRVEEAYYDYWTIQEDIHILLKNDPNYAPSLKVVNEAMNLIDLRNRDELFFASLKKSHAYLINHYFKGELCDKKDVIVDCIGHAHIDMAWLWDIEQTHHKGLRTFATALKLMEEYPDYKYMHTSPQLIKFIQKDDPELFARIKKRVQEGRFELDGAMWVEPDCNLTSGESLVRQILYGKNYLKKEFGIDSKTLILPDVFGYSYQIPQILAKSGVNRFVTGKIGWNDTNRLPYDSFKWVGLDGTSVFTYLISTCDANPRVGVKDTNYTTYNGWMTANQLLGTWNRYEVKKYNNRVITTFGFGDGGGGPTREMLEKEKRYRFGLPNLGKTHLTTLKDSLKAIEDNFNRSCKKFGKTPTWKDELYLEYHRGTYTSVPRIKKYNRDLEFSFLNTELIASLDAIINHRQYPKDIIDENYETFLLHQFHDILPGSSIGKVYEDADKYLGKILKDNKSIINKHLDALLCKENSQYMVFNPNAFNMDTPVMVNHKCYVVKNVPSVGYQSFKLIHQPNQIKISERHLSNAYFDVRFNKLGEITSCYDKTHKKEMVKPNEVINQFVVYEDMPYKYDNWEMSPYYKQKRYPITSPATFSVINKGDCQGFKITRRYYKSTIVQFVYLYNGIKRVDFVNQITWKEKRQLLKIHFPFNVKCEQARFDIQFGSIGRNVKPKNSFDEAKFEVCGQKWVDMSDGKYGIALINDSKYGYGTNDNDISLTVLKSGSYPFDGATDICPEFRFALFPHLGDYRNDEIVKESHAFNRPAFVYENKKAKGYEDIKHSFISLAASSVVLETVKRAYNEKAYIIRGYETGGRAHEVRLNVNVPFKTAYLADLMENNLKPLLVKNNTIKLNIKPFEIFTIKIKE